MCVCVWCVLRVPRMTTMATVDTQYLATNCKIGFEKR